MEGEARQLVELCRVDFIWPTGESQEVKDFPKKFPHLIQPFFGDWLFIKQPDRRCRAHVLDVYNALVHWHKTPEWKAFSDLKPANPCPVAISRVRHALASRACLKWLPRETPAGIKPSTRLFDIKLAWYAIS